jgi:4-hydroxyphenylpyruvate dioxygenase-like putative hemolysin
VGPRAVLDAVVKRKIPSGGKQKEAAQVEIPIACEVGCAVADAMVALQKYAVSGARIINQETQGTIRKEYLQNNATRRSKLQNKVR